jgi:alditol oxidase
VSSEQAAAAASAQARRTNWAGNVTFGAQRFHEPATVPELQRIVARSTHARALGTGHAFNYLADTDGDLITVGGLPQLIEVDRDGYVVTVSAGVSYGDLATALNEAGQALPNMASLPHISVAGACATGTHGSGDTNGSLAAAVSAIEMVTADGDLVTISRHGDPARFPGMVVALGALGIVTRVTLETVPAFEVRQYVYEDLPYETVTEHLDEITSAAYSVSLFTDWRAPRVRQVWLKRRADSADRPPEPVWMGARLADGPRNPVPGMPPGAATEQLGVPGMWHERLPHFRLEFTPSAGDELQSEFLLPRAQAASALLALDQIASQLAPVTQISEIRTVAADDLWLSPAYLQDTVAFHFTWVSDWPAVEPVLALVQDRLMPLHARPHWGKLFTASAAALRERYPRLADFRRLTHDYDPSGTFRNDFVDRCLTPR